MQQPEGRAPIVVPGNPDPIDRVGVDLSPLILAHPRVRSLVLDLLGLLPQPRRPETGGFSRFAAVISVLAKSPARLVR